MSILNYHVTRDRVLIAVDSIVGDVKGWYRFHFCKLYPITHSNMVVAGRGNARLVRLAARACAGMQDIDEVRDRLRPILGLLLLRQLIFSAINPFAVRALLHPSEIHVCGFSAEKGGMVVLDFIRDGGLGGFVLEEDSSESVAPAGVESPETWSHRSMLSLARQQLRQEMASGEPARKVIGGRLIVAELTRWGLWVDTSGVIDPADNRSLKRPPWWRMP